MAHPRWPVVLLACVALGQHAGAGGSVVDGSGNETSESRSVAGFAAVAFGGGGRVVVEQTGAESLTITAEDNVLPFLTSEVRAGRLMLGVRSDTSIRTTKAIVYRVTVKTLSEIELSGSGSVEATRIDADRLTIVSHGSGRLTVAGKTDRQDVTLTGSGSYRGENLDSREGTITISGSGRAIVRVSDRLDAEVSGSGSVEYIGHPVVRRNVSGSGSVRRR